MKIRTLKLFLLLSLLSCQAHAHTGHTATNGFSSGLLHPITGLDHTIAMLAVGILGQQLSQAWQWRLPTLFLLGLFAGALLGVSQFHFTYTELGIVLSIVLLGFFVTVPNKLPKIILASCVFIFALCHGHAHGTEMTGTLASHYFLGFMLASSLLHASGWFIARQCQTYLSSKVVNISGFGMMLSGLWMLT